MTFSLSKLLKFAPLLLLGLFFVAQLIPYGRNHTNPPITSEIAWDSPETEQLVRTACYDCHSNETVWPWYSNIAPISWLVQRDTDNGRQHLNFSEWMATQTSNDDHGHAAEPEDEHGHDVEPEDDHGHAAESDDHGHGADAHDVDDIIEILEAGEMPPRIYLIGHSDARLSATDHTQLLAGIRASLNIDE